MTSLIHDLAGRFRLSKRSQGFGGDCPACGYPNAFTVRILAGRPVLHCFNGCDRNALQATVPAVLRRGWTPPQSFDDAAQRNRQARQDRAQQLWHLSLPCRGTLAETYLARRGIPHVASSDALRFQSNCSHPSGSLHPALVAAVRNAAGALVAVQRTYLASDGGKAALDPARASLGSVWGAAVQLDPCGPELVVGEGMESTASAGNLLGLPAWAALSAGNLERGLVLPGSVHRVIIAVDHDPIGQRAARGAAERWLKEGRAVRLVTPDRPGTDFNDLVQAQMVGVADG